MKKITMKNPIVEMDGDEMTRILWKWTKELLIEPYVELNSDYYDLGLPNRERTADQVTKDAAQACLRHGVAVKCATITPNEARIKEYSLSQKWPSPNATLRSIIGGTIIRKPILLPFMQGLIPTWTKPITVARHAYGDVYSSRELRIDKPGRVDIVFTPEDASEPIRKEIYSFSSSGVVQGMHNTDREIKDFAEACFGYALETKQDLWFGAKDTISQTYDAKFREVFDAAYEQHRQEFEKESIHYFYMLIDDAVARVMRSNGGFIWACKNYDGDVMSDMVSTVYGSLAMMTSVLISPKGAYEYEAAHGTVTRHYYRYLNGEQTSTNPMATIFAWTGALARRGQMDDSSDLTVFAQNVEKSALAVIESGRLTKDLAAMTTFEAPTVLTSREFFEEIAKELSKCM